MKDTILQLYLILEKYKQLLTKEERIVILNTIKILQNEIELEDDLK